MTVEIRHLRAFLAIAEEGNLTRAARRSHLTQPALSRTLAQLERDLGVRLVDRSTHHLALTDAGHRFEQHAFDAVRAFETAVASAGGREAPLRIGHSWSAGTYLSRLVRAWNAVERPCPVMVVRSEDRSAGLTSGKVAGPDVGAVDDWLVAIASGEGFGVSVASTAVLHPHPDVRYVPLTDAARVPVLLAWPRRGEHPALKELLRVAREAMAR